METTSCESFYDTLDNRVKIESKSIAVDKGLSMAEFYGRLICNSKKRGMLSLLVAIPCEYSTEEAHPVYVPEEAARVVDGVYEEVDITKKKNISCLCEFKGTRSVGSIAD